MCNATTYSESGARLTPARCADYIALASDRDRLAGVVIGLEEQNARNLDALRRAEAENVRITLQYDQFDDIFRQRVFDLSQSMARALELEKENARLREALNTAEITAGNTNASRDDPWEILAAIENLASNALRGGVMKVAGKMLDLKRQIAVKDAETVTTTARLQTMAASISGILDRSATADQCMATIERHVARTGERVQELVTESSALMRERDALKARLAGTVYDGTPATLPPVLTDVLVEMPGGTRFCCKHDTEGYVVFANDDSLTLTKGCRWWMWPGGGE